MLGIRPPKNQSNRFLYVNPNCIILVYSLLRLIFTIRCQVKKSKLINYNKPTYEKLVFPNPFNYVTFYFAILIELSV